MSGIRSAASRLLRAVLRYAPPDSQDWVNAMLRELDFIESDWAAFFWALGSTTAIFKYSVPRRLRAWFGKNSGAEEKLMIKDIGKKAAGVASGVAIAAGVTLGAFGLVWLMFYLFPKWDLGPVPWWVGVIVLPETIFVVAIVALWRKRRPMAVGILLLAVTLGTHFIVHVVNHYHGTGQ
jgi:hypothetical protein